MQSPSKRKAKAAFNVILSGKNIFLVQEEDGTWGLPGGGIEKGETSLEGARRELKEETDFKTSVDDADIKGFLDISNNKSFKVVAYIYCISSKEKGKFKNCSTLNNGETLACRWFSREEFNRLNLRKPLRKQKKNIQSLFY